MSGVSFCGRTSRSIQQGFTLIELAIVLVVMALIIAGVISGQSLIKRAQFNKMMKDVEVIGSAANAFRIRYEAIPGDMSNASNFWSVNNGNGDGKIGREAGVQNSMERLLAWRHMNLAGIYPGAFTGTDPTSGQSDVGVNVPASPIKKNTNAGREVGYDFYYADPSIWGEVSRAGHYVFIAATVPNWFLHGAALSPYDAQALDTKYDNGNSSTGRMGYLHGVLASTGTWSANCYDVTYTSAECMMYVRAF